MFFYLYVPKAKYKVWLNKTMKDERFVGNRKSYSLEEEPFLPCKLNQLYQVIIFFWQVPSNSTDGH